MAVDISLHPIGNPVQGNHPPSGLIPRIQGQVALADGVASDVLVVPKLGARLVLVSTMKARIDIRTQADAGNLNPLTTGMILGSNERVVFSLPQGSWQLMISTFV